MYGPARAAAVNCHGPGTQTTAISFLIALGSKVHEQGVGRVHLSRSLSLACMGSSVCVSLHLCLVRTVDLGLRPILETGHIAQWVRTLLHRLEGLSLNPQDPGKNNTFTYTYNPKTEGARDRRLTGV